MATVLDNPAGRLHSILQKLKSAGANTSTRAALQQVISPNSEDPAALARQIGILISLPDQVVSEINAMEEMISHEILFRWHDPVTLALNDLLFHSGTIGQITGRYGPGELVSLEACSDLLHRHRREASLSEVQLKHIEELLDELHAAVRQDSHMDLKLRGILLNHIHAMEQAIEDMPLVGTQGLEQAVASVQGHLVMRKDLLAKQDGSSATWQKLTALLSVITAALSLGSTAIQAIEQKPSSPPSQNITVITGSPGLKFDPPRAISGPQP
ncbi:MAG: hypothetical protein J2P31_20740 [Blastocatellia bacterium]|nr:hypothetical protein [Blastocatellia bacterium]